MATLTELIGSWAISLRAANRSLHRLQYGDESVAQSRRWMVEHEPAVAPAQTPRDRVEHYPGVIAATPPKAPRVGMRPVGCLGRITSQAMVKELVNIPLVTWGAKSPSTSGMAHTKA